MPSTLETRLQEKLGIKLELIPDQERLQRIISHYNRCINKHGMGLNRAIDLALSNLSRSNRHDVIRP